MKVEKAPAMPFYGKQFYDDEAVWLSSLAHQGLYVALLWQQWANGSVPDDVRLIARLVGQREADVRRLWEEVSRHFEPHPTEPGRIINAQLEKVREDMVKLREKRSKAGSKGGSKAQASLQAKIKLPYGDGEGDGDFLLDEGECEGEFARLWQQYPRKRGRDDAERHFFAQVTTRAGVAAVESAIRNYRREIEILGTEEKHILHGSTFFNGRWKDFVDGVWKEPDTKKRGDYPPVTTFVAPLKD